MSHRADSGGMGVPSWRKPRHGRRARAAAPVGTELAVPEAGPEEAESDVGQADLVNATSLEAGAEGMDGSLATPNDATASDLAGAADGEGDNMDTALPPAAPSKAFELSPNGGEPPEPPLLVAAKPTGHSGVSRRKKQQLKTGAGTQQQAKNWKKYDDAEMAETILDIPELEEEGKEDISAVVADAPKVRHHRVQSIHQLEQSSPLILPSLEADNIDLSLLAACLLPMDQVDEGDDIWEDEVLFTEVTSAISKDHEALEKSGLARGKSGVLPDTRTPPVPAA